MDNNRVMSLGDHLDELRARLIAALLVPIPVFALCLTPWLGGAIMEFLLAPVTQQLDAAGQTPKLLATSPMETFAAYLRVAAVITLLVTIPWIIFQLWKFISPGLHESERKFVYFLMPASAALSTLGAAFLYYILLPVSLFFLISFGASLVQQHPGTATIPEEGIVYPMFPVLDGDPPQAPIGAAWINTDIRELRFQITEDEVRGTPLRGSNMIAQEYRIGEYISLVFMLGIVLAVAFQLPLVLMLLGWVGILEPRDLTPHRRVIGLGCAVAGAVLTPQDPWSMIALGGALYILFELGIVLMRFTPARYTDANEGDE